MQQQWTIYWLDCDMQWKVDSIWQPVRTNLVSGLRRSSKHFPKPKLHQKRSWPLFSNLLPFWSPIALWIPVKPLHLSSMLSALIRCTKNCNTCSWHWSTESLNSPWQCLIHRLQNQKLNKLGCNICLTHHIHLSLPNQLPLLQASQWLFAWKTFSQPAGGRKCFPTICWIPKHEFLQHKNKQTYFPLAKMCWL